MRKDILERKEEILKWISEQKAKAWMAKELRCKIDTLDSWLIKMDIQYAGNMSGKGFPKDNQYKPAILYMHKDSTLHSSRLKEKLFREGLKKRKCEVCGITEWCGQPAPLELDHIDGDHWNNEWSNLRILCPNCHAMTDTNSGRNKKRYMGS